MTATYPADPGGPHHHSARPPLRPRRGARRGCGTAGASKRLQSTMRCRRPSRSARPFSSKACARSATARRPSSPRRSRPSPRRRRSTAASMTRSTGARRDAGYDLSKLEAQVEKRLAVTRVASRRSSASPRPWRSSISPRSSPTSCSPIRGISPAPTRRRPSCGAGMPCEEIEHKGVAYDTWLHATRDWPRSKRWKVKAKVMLYVTRNFLVDRTAGALELMRQDGVTGLRAWARLLWYLWVRPGHVPQDRRRLVQIFPARLPPVERGRPRTCCAAYEASAANAAPEPSEEGAARGLGRQRLLLSRPLRSPARSRISRAGASAPRAQLIRGAMMPSGSKPSFSSTRAEAGLSRKCEPSRLRQAERRGRCRSARRRLRSRSRGPNRAGRSNSPARPRPTDAGRARTRRPAAARPSVRSKIRKDGRTGSRGLREEGLGVAHAVGPRRGRQVADDRLVGDRLWQAPAHLPANPASAAVLAFSRTSLLLLRRGRLAAAA